MKTFNKAPLALVISALLVAPAAMATNVYDTDSSIDSAFDNNIDVDIKHDQGTQVRTNIVGESSFSASNYSGATVDSKQLSDDNESTQKRTNNSANVDGNALQRAGGNIGANVAAGGNNQQANDAALATSDASTVFGQASSFSVQSASNTTNRATGSSNSASLRGNALQSAGGNIGVNIAAGTGNAQHNSLAMAVNTSSGNAQATTGGVQATYGSFVEFDAIGLGGTSSGTNADDRNVMAYQHNNATLGGNALQAAGGNIGVNMASGGVNLQRNSLSIASSMASSNP